MSEFLDLAAKFSDLLRQLIRVHLGRFPADLFQGGPGSQLQDLLLQVVNVFLEDLVLIGSLLQGLEFLMLLTAGLPAKLGQALCHEADGILGCPDDVLLFFELLTQGDLGSRVCLGLAQPGLQFGRSLSRGDGEQVRG